ncbi:hypothetical protein BGM09_05040 [Streptomyces sp. CBMA29]|nr:hypothetical protein [Streptomyces sp. CBMA29]
MGPAGDEAAVSGASPGPGGGSRTPVGPTGRHPRDGVRGPRGRWITAATVAAVVGLTAGLLALRPWDGGASGHRTADAKGARSGPARPASASASGSAPASALGDARTADPCSLLATASLTRFGRAELATAYGNFDRCDVLVEGPGADSSADVAATFIGTDVETGTQVRTREAGNVTIAAEPLDGDECDRTLRLGDGSHVQIMARQTGASAPDLCAMADAATDHAVSVLAASGTVARRPSAAAPGSLAAADACALLTATALGRVQGVDAARRDAGFGNWGCHWGGSSGDTGVDLVFDRNSPPLDASDGKRVQLGSREGFLAEEYEDTGTCTARIVNRTYKDLQGDTTQELVELTVAGPGPVTALCDTARQLGEVAAARLPKA